MKAIKITFLVFIFLAIVFIFYKEEVRYMLPTPIPHHLATVPVGTHFEGQMPQNLHSNNKIKFLHFFNPSCPCSKFNQKHMAELIRQYSNQVEFYSVLEKSTDPADYAILYGEKSVIVDTLGKWAKMFGVYATPQAIILSENNTLLYKGNFNKARFCTEPKTQFAQQALDSIVKGYQQLTLSPYAKRAYGCSFY